MNATHRAEVEDTYAEAFRSIYAEVLITARLTTWTVSGPGLRALANSLRGRPGVEQVVAFGNTLHLSGRDRAALEASLAPWRGGPYTVRPIDSSLEDVFISLMESAKDNFA